MWAQTAAAALPVVAGMIGGRQAKKAERAAQRIRGQP